MRRLLPALLLLLAAAVAVSPCTPRGDSVADLFSRARALGRDYEYREAEALYRRALTWEPGNQRAMCGLAGVLYRLGEYPGAERLYRTALELDPTSPEPARGLGNMAIRLLRKAEARRYMEVALDRAPDDARTLAGMARVEIEEGDFASADEHLRRAEELRPDSPLVLNGRATWHFRRRKPGGMTAAARLLRRTLEIDPHYLPALQRLANGFLEEDAKPYSPPRVSNGFAMQVARAARLYRDLALDEAEAAFAKLDTPEAEDGRPAFYRGLSAIRRGRPREAIEHLWRALDREPENHLFRNAIAYAYRLKIFRQRAEYGGGGGPDRIAPLARALPEPGEIDGIERVVRGYERLLPGERAVVRRATAPFAAFLPRLVEKGATFDILGFEEGVCDAGERRWLLDRRTHDGRWYGGIRGVGGLHAATGIEQILEARDLRYDTFAHELAHQVHRFGLGEGERILVRRLYEEAKAADRCLDYYAAQNEWEYFAQGYEAFVSLVRHPFHSSIRRHTRFELADRDPALYRFLLRITKTEDPDPAVLELAPKLAAFYEWAGDAVTLRQFRAWLEPAASPR